MQDTSCYDQIYDIKPRDPFSCVIEYTKGRCAELSKGNEFVGRHASETLGNLLKGVNTKVCGSGWHPAALPVPEKAKERF
jgi:hypothetical protein